jgi:hypothetical protein
MTEAHCTIKCIRWYDAEGRAKLARLLGKPVVNMPQRHFVG